MIKVNKYNVFLTLRRIFGITLTSMALYLIGLFFLKFVFWFLYAGTTLIDSFFRFLVR